jgi:adenosine kinase
MRIAVTGSVAEDNLMTFPGKFAEVIMPDQIHRLSLSFLVKDLEVRRGGTAANIAFGMAWMGLKPLLVASVGKDFLMDYGPHLEARGVDISHVRVSETQHTARFICTTDEEQNQVASFYPGAMGESAEIDIEAIHKATGGLDLVIVSPNDPGAMVKHTQDAKRLGIPVAADPSQQLPVLDGDQIRELIDGAAYLLCNDYEAGLIESRSGWDGPEILKHVQVRVTTHGADGCVIEQEGQEPIKVGVVPPKPGVQLEPTGVGDAFRSGFMAGRAAGLGLERCAQLGATLATHVLESIGTQEYAVDRATFNQRLRDAYGDAAADEVVDVINGIAS